MAVTYSVRISGGRFDSFLGFEYGIVISLASRVFQVLLPILPTSLRFLRTFSFVGVTLYCGPTLIASPHVLITCGRFIGF